MQAIAIVSLLSFGEPDPEALVAQASAVCERIKSYDARYDVEVRDFVPLAAERSHVKEKPGGNPGSQAEVFEKLRDIRFLERGDERAVRKRARVRFVRRGEDFLVRFDDLWIRTPSWTSTSVLVLGRKGGTGLIYRSQPTFEPGSRMAPLEVSTGVLRKAPTFS